MVRIALVEDDANYRQELTEYLNRFSQECGEHFAISTFKGGMRKLAVSQIAYVEVQDHDLTYHTADEVLPAK